MKISSDYKNRFVDNYIIHIGGNSNTNYFEVWQKNDEDNSWIKRKANDLGSLNKWNQRPAAFWVNEK